MSMAAPANKSFAAAAKKPKQNNNVVIAPNDDGTSDQQIVIHAPPVLSHCRNYKDVANTLKNTNSVKEDK